ncbi:hypothetical protein [Natronorubrum halophilum]|uniref:hypothetical protein n=1 Tax=Natronorubrum halophilum TaxID=1702106 RepID=UPI0010C202F4|nr:hypothetical protein [Natronorubrum halophilum]
MSALRPALLEWDADRIVRILVAGVSVFLAVRVTDGVLVGLGAAVLFTVAFNCLWEIATRIGGRFRAAS